MFFRTVTDVELLLNEAILVIEENQLVGDDAGSKKYKKDLRDLKRIILARYRNISPAQQQNLYNLALAFKNAACAANNTKVNFVWKGKMLSAAIEAAEDCKDIIAKPEEQEEQLRSETPILIRVLGGLIGLMLGVPIGAMAGFIFPVLQKLLWIFICPSLGSLAPSPDLLSLQICAGIGAVCGGFGGMWLGSSWLADKMYYCCHGSFFKPGSVKDIATPIIQNVLQEPLQVGARSSR